MSGSGQHLTVPGAVSSEEAASSSSARPRSGSTSTTSQPSQLLQSPSVEEADYWRRPSVRIERRPSRQSIRANDPASSSDNVGGGTGGAAAAGGGGGGGFFSSLSVPVVGRSRSQSDPATRRGSGALRKPSMSGMGPSKQQPYMPEIVEGTISRGNEQDDAIAPVGEATSSEARSSSTLPPLRHARTNIGVRRTSQNPDGEYDNLVVDFLDVMDPEVSTLTTLTNVQNSLFVPDLGKYLNRRPTYILTQRPGDLEPRDSSSFEEEERPQATGETAQRPQAYRTATGQTLNTITSRLNERYFAVLPHGVQLDGWSEEDKLEMNDLVRHMMHSRRSKFRRSMRGFGQYVRKPLGFFVTLYATLITLFGLAWVLFLIGWVNVGGKQIYLIHIIDSVLVALFAIVGDGLAPFRAVDTYHMIYIAHYHHLTWRLRKERSLPDLQNRSDLPSLPPSDSSTIEKGPETEYSVLTPAQQKKLEHHQKKFSRSHSFYKPHETSTHRAFSLRLLVAVVVLLDCHSLLQISLGACTWGISYHVRPFALTTVILCCSITVNITAGVIISIGDKRSRKKDVVEKLFRQQLTEEAMHKVERRKIRQLREELEKRGVAEEDIEQTLSLHRPIPSVGDVPAIKTTSAEEEGKN